MRRYLFENIKKDLTRKIILLSGPRQVGKTTLAKQIDLPKVEYLNFDAEEDREIIRKKSWKRDIDLIILDELHKKPKWKTWLKGIYDKEGNSPQILVTGSARLDIYRKGGDSLAGRYFPYRLHPFSVAELTKNFSPEEALDNLIRLGGFPEPLLGGSEEAAARWRRTHIERIIKEDVLDFEIVHDLKTMGLLVELLSRQVGSPISYDSLARDLDKSPNTIKKWISILEEMYIIFVVRPYTKNIRRGILKQPKIYFYDSGYVKGEIAQKYENTVACALLKNNHFLEDTKGEKRQLHYLRDREKKEVDFCVVCNDQVELLVETKLSDSDTKQIQYFHNQVNEKIDAVLLVKNLAKEEDYANVKIRKAATWLATLSA